MFYGEKKKKKKKKNKKKYHYFLVENRAFSRVMVYGHRGHLGCQFPIIFANFIALIPISLYAVWAQSALRFRRRSNSKVLPHGHGHLGHWFPILIVNLKGFVTRMLQVQLGYPSKHTTSPQRRYNVAATSRRCSDVVTTLWRRCVFTGTLLKSLQRSRLNEVNQFPIMSMGHFSFHDNQSTLAYISQNCFPPSQNVILKI